MSGIRAQGITVGNEFVVPKTSMIIDLPAEVEPVTIPPVSSVYTPSPPAIQTIVPKWYIKAPSRLWENSLNTLHRNSITVYALLLLAISVAGLPLATRYFSSNIKLIPVSIIKPIHVTSGLNIALNSNQFQPWLQAITAQQASLNLGNTTVAISPDIIKSWLQVTTNTDKSEYNVHINSTVIANSLQSLANKYVKAPFNQVTITRSDGSTELAVAGRNGSQLSDPASIVTQASQLSKVLFSNKGFQISAPLVTVPFQSVTPSSFSKLLVADVNSKNMYAYENGQLVKTFLVSAGKPTTPTPNGEFHIYSKLVSQDMKGFNSDGSKYFQPHVQWINYFDGGDAIHAVYWHPLSWFGVHNSSHGCVGVSTSDGEWIYNWAPIGTTVITTPN